MLLVLLDHVEFFQHTKLSIYFP